MKHVHLSIVRKASFLLELKYTFKCTHCIVAKLDYLTGSNQFTLRLSVYDKKKVYIYILCQESHQPTTNKRVKVLSESEQAMRQNMMLGKFLLPPLLLTVGDCSKEVNPPSAREMYDSMSKMVTGSAYPPHWCTIIIIITTVIVTTITVIIILTTTTTINIVPTLLKGGRSATPAWPPSRPCWRARWTRPGRS